MATSTVSPQLVWLTIRKNNCFLRKVNEHTTFSCEKNNMTSTNSYRFSGLTNPKPAGLTLHGKCDSSITLHTAAQKFSSKRKPSKNAISRKFTRNSKNVSSLAKKLFAYRPDLIPYAIRKYKKLSKTRTISNQ